MKGTCATCKHSCSKWDCHSPEYKDQWWTTPVRGTVHLPTCFELNGNWTCEVWEPDLGTRMGRWVRRVTDET